MPKAYRDAKTSQLGKCVLRRSKNKNKHDHGHNKGKVGPIYLSGVPAGATNGTSTSAGLRNMLYRFNSPADARKQLRNYYLKLGYSIGRNNEMIPPKDSDKPIIVIPKLTKMPRGKPGKAGIVMARGVRQGMIHDHALKI